MAMAVVMVVVTTVDIISCVGVGVGVVVVRSVMQKYTNVLFLLGLMVLAWAAKVGGNVKSELCNIRL